MISTVIFDFGGVLIEWDPRFLYRRFFNSEQAMESFLLEIDFMGWNMLQDRGRPFSEGVRELSSRFPQHDRLIRLYHEHWVESIGSPITGTLKILRRVKALGYRVYGLSNWSSETFPIIRARFDFFDLLDGYVISGEVGMAKPEQAIFRLLLDRLNRKPQECLFIDDSPANVDVARRLGFKCIRFLSPAQLENELVELDILKEAL